MEFSGPKIRYLLAIAAVSNGQNGIRSVDVARKLGVSRPSVHRMLGVLAYMGLIVKEPHRAARLTARGRALAAFYQSRFTCLHDFFKRSLGLSEDACGRIVLAFLACRETRCMDELCNAVRETETRIQQARGQ